MRVVLALAGLLLLVGCETETPLSREAGNGYWLCSVGDSWNQLTYASPTGFVTRVKLRNIPNASYLEYELHGTHEISRDSITATTTNLRVLWIEPPEGQLLKSRPEAMAAAGASLVTMHQDNPVSTVKAGLSPDLNTLTLSSDDGDIECTRPKPSTLLNDWGIATM